jgi:D-alanine-D-alanine ligase
MGEGKDDEMKGSGEEKDTGPLRVAVLMGGQSAERKVSLETGRTVLRELGPRHDLVPVEILASGHWVVGGRASVACQDAPAILDELEVDVVFNALHGPLGEDGCVQGLFRMLGMPLTGPDVIPAAVTMDKRLTKLSLAASGVLTPRFFAIEHHEIPRSATEWRFLGESRASTLPFPWVLKPNRLGSSVGVGLVGSPQDLAAEGPRLVAEAGLAQGGDDILIEELIRGRELSCGVLEVGAAPRRARALPPIEIRPRDSAFFDYRAKYTPGASEEVCPAPLTRAERETVESTAVLAHTLFRCAPLSRTDMFLTPAGEVQVLEVNTLPGLTWTSLIPLSASTVGLPLRDLLESLVEHAIERARGWRCVGEPAAAEEREAVGAAARQKG